MEKLAVTSLGLGVLCASIIVADIVAGHRQHMWIMNIVWPTTALYGGPFALWAYYALGRLSTERAMEEAKEKGDQSPSKRKKFWQSTALAATHCGSGCTIADIVGECALSVVPVTLFGMRMYGAWVVDYVLALLVGIFFQYFTIAPMKNLGFKDGIKAAIKADVLSLTAWQVGMYGCMAIATFLVFGHELSKTDPLFWFVMQMAMLAGFATAYPVNWWLIRAGIKETM